MTFYTLSLETNDTSLITRLELCGDTVIPLSDYSFTDFTNPDNRIQLAANVFAETGVIIQSITVISITGGIRVEIKSSCNDLRIDTELDSHQFTNESSEDLVVCTQCLAISGTETIISIATPNGKLDSEFAVSDAGSVAGAAYIFYLTFANEVYFRYSDGQFCASMFGNSFYLTSVTTGSGNIDFGELVCTEPTVNCDSITASLDAMLYESPNVYKAVVVMEGCTDEASFNWEIDTGSATIDATDNEATVTVNEHVRIHVTAACDGCEFEFFRDLYSEQASPCASLVSCDSKEAVDVFRTLLYKDIDNCPVIKIKMTENPVSCLDKCGDMTAGEAYADAVRLAATSDGVLAATPSGVVLPFDCNDIFPATGNAFLSKDTITGCVAVNVINRGTDASGCSHDCDDHEVILKAISKCGDCYAVNVVEAEQATDVPYIDCSNASLSTETLVRMLLRKVSDNVYAFAVKIT